LVRLVRLVRLRPSTTRPPKGDGVALAWLLLCLWFMPPLETLVHSQRAAFRCAGRATGLTERATLWLRRNSALRWTRRLAPLGASGLGFWLCVRFCSQLDWRAVAHDMRQVGVGAPLLFLAPVVGNVLHALGWRGLLPAGARPGLGRSLAIFLASQAGNEIGLGVLGESLKVTEFEVGYRAAAWRAVLLDNFTSLLALLAVLLSLWLVLAGIAKQLPLPRAALLGALLALGGASLAGLGLWARSSGGSPVRVLTAFAAHYLGKLWLVAEFALLLGLLGTVTLRASAVLALVATLASAVGAAIPGQLGVLEAALKGSAAACELGVGTLVSVALLRRARSVLWVGLGALFYWHLRARRLRRAREA
jgi:hypothetical protein